MKFSEIVKQASALLQDKGQVSYRMLKREFGLEDEGLEDLKAELIEIDGLAVDQDGKMLVWKGMAAAREPGTPNIEASERKPVSYDTDTGGDKPKDPRLDTAERRQLTVMFCDLVGSTALSEQLDPEEYREVVRTYQDACTTVISRYEGHIAQHLGDGLLVYFGYPAAHEDDAQRAVRTGLEIGDVIPTLVFPRHMRLPQPLQVRIGIHTGPVVVGEIGRSDRREMLALGETPNLAARVQGEAAPNTVVLSAATYRLAEGLFEYQDLGPHLLKGISVPLSLYRVVGESGVQSRFEAAVHTGLTPLVGREEELGLLRRRWERAKAGEGQVVLLSGEAGIGKSRLVQRLKEQVAGETQVQVECRCSAYSQNSALYPVITHLQKVLQFGREEAANSKLQKLERMLSAYQLPLAEAVPLVAALLSLPHPEGYTALRLSPQKQRQRTLETVLAWLLKEAERQPVRVVWEDLHWADPTTLEFVQLLIEQAPTTRMLVLATFRPEFQPPWPGRSHITQLMLTRLRPRQVEVMVDQVTGGKTLPAEVVQQIVAKTDGVPLFVEELTKMVVESGLLREADGHSKQRGAFPSLAIPTTLQDSLMARLDRLAAAKEVAQLGAALGREFSYEVLREVALYEENALQQALIQLVEAEILYQHGLPPRAHYLFKHALIQDAAYQSLLKSTRQRYHKQIAQVLEERFPETAATQPELLAHHYTEAGLVEQAIPYWQQAGERANQRSAYVEAINHLTKALELLKTLPDTPERELDLQTALGQAMMVTKGYADPAVAQVYTRARALCRQVGETPHLFSVLWGLWAVFLMRNQLETARELAEQLVHTAQRTQDSALLVAAYFTLGDTLFALGDFVSSRENFEQGIALYDPLSHRAFAFRYGQDPGVTCLAQGAIVLWYLGYPEQSLTWAHKALTLAQEPFHPFSAAYSLDWAAVVYQLRNEARMVQEQAKAANSLSREHEFPFWLAFSTILCGWGLSQQGQQEEGIAQIREGLAAWQTEGSEVLRPYALALLAEVYGKAGRREEGLTVLAEALSLGGPKAEQHYGMAELYRLKGELTQQKFQVQGSTFQVTDSQSSIPDAQTKAEAYFHKAIEIAHQQQAKSLELRASTSIARLWQQQGKRHEAHKLLSEIYGWFTEGFDTTDLQEAKALLAELGEER